MLTLTRASIVSRKTIRYSVYAIILIVVVRMLINFGVGLYNRLFPEPPPPPTVKFGSLPALPFPEKETVSEIQYILETPDGNLPEFEGQLPVYFMPTSSTSIRALEQAKSKAQKLGFNPNGRELVETVYVFNRPGHPSSLTLNIVTDIFSISYDINSNPSIVGGLPQNKEQSVNFIKNFLNQGGFANQDLGEATHYYLDIIGGDFVEVSAPSEARLAKTNMYRNKLGSESNIPSVTPDFIESNVWFIRSGNGEIVAGEYHYYPIDYQQNGTYPIITSDEAWEKLKAGGAYIANMGENAGQVTIRNVYLAYYDAGQYTQYYQPVVVFEGDNNFAAYVPAITQDFYGTGESIPSTTPQ